MPKDKWNGGQGRTGTSSSTPAPGHRGGDTLFAYAILTLLPIALLAVGPNWIVSGLFNDPWIYFGYYLDLSAHLKTFDGLYYGCRLSAILPGWLAYRILPPIAANLVLHLGLYFAGLFAFHETVKETVSRRAALLSAVLLGTNPFYLNAVGHDYVDGFGVVYSLLSIFCLSRAATANAKHWRIFLLGAGVFAAAMVVAFLTSVLLIPFTILFYLVANRANARNPWLASAFWWCLGGLSLVVFLGGVNWIFTGSVWFLAASFKFMRQMANSPNYFVDRSMSWLPSAVWLAIPFLVFLGSLIRLRRAFTYEGRPNSRLSIYYWGQLVGLVLLFMAFDVRTGSSLLLPWFYASQLIPATFLALAALVAEPIGAMTARSYTALVLFAVVTSLASPALIAAGYALDVAGLAPMILIVPVCIAAALVLTTSTLRASSRLTVFLLLLFLVESMAQSGFKEESSMITLQKDPDFVRQTYLGKPPRSVKPYGVRLRAYRRLGFDVLLAIHDAVRNIQQVDPVGQTFFWFGFDEPDGVLFNNIACTYTWGIRILNLDFPSLNDGRTIDHVAVAPGMKILVLSNHPDVAGTAQLSLSQKGFDSKIVVVKHVQHGSIAFSMTFLEVVEKADSQPAS